MIKIIASDMDGTLLQNGAQSISPRALDLIEKITKQGILFVAASGRQYPNLYRLFGDLSENMAFIAENGALVMYKNEVIYKDVIERNLAMSIIKDIDDREGCEVLISGKDTSIVKPKTATYLNRMQNVVKNNVTLVKDFDEIKEDILKVSLFEQKGIENSTEYFTNKWSSKLKCTVSGLAWIDFVNLHVNKGNSLRKLMDTLHITTEEAMAFGDNYNDLEMLSTVKYGYAMENAVEDIKNRYDYHTTSVEDVLEEVYSYSSRFQ